MSMVPVLGRLPVTTLTASIGGDGRPTPEFREQLRRIASFRNAMSVVLLFGQTVGVIAMAMRVDRWWLWLLAFVWMGRANAQFASLMHEAAHRLLFARKSVNDFVGRWLLGYPVWTNTDAYRRVHMAHHRQEFGPDEPDIALYRNYPIPKSSMRRKLFRDARGSTGLKLWRQQMGALFRTDRRARRTLLKILAVQAVIAGLFIVSGFWWAYPVIWVGPWLTVWRVINRLRAIAEHGGMVASKDRRATTHSVRQSPVAMFAMVPYNIGFHLAHHVDSGVPFRNLPRFHDALRAAHYVDDNLEYASYRHLWRALRSG